MKKVEIYTDGACRGNPGCGGWGAIISYNGVEKELSGGERETTNNRMELTAAISGLSALKEPCEVSLYSDSKYLVDAINKGWLDSWVKKGWKKADGKAVLNIDLWQKLISLFQTHKVTLIWVKGHNENIKNERCDALACSEADKLK